MTEFLTSIDADGTAVVRVVGEVDLAAAESLKLSVRHAMAESTAVVVDLSHVTFMDSSGLGVLIHLAQQAVRGGTSLTLTGVTPSTYRLLKITGLTAVFDIREGNPESNGTSSP